MIILNNELSVRTPPSKNLLERVRDKIRLKHYSLSTEKNYLQWIKRFILYHNKKHPKYLGKGAKRRERVPVVLSQEEVHRIIEDEMPPRYLNREKITFTKLRLIYNPSTL